MRKPCCAFGVAALLVAQAGHPEPPRATEIPRGASRVAGSAEAAESAARAHAETDDASRRAARRSADDPFPDLRGRLVFHRYTSYEERDGKLFMLDLSDRSLTELSAEWDIEHIINPHISPDGTRIVFGGDDTTIPAHDHDIYLWEVGAPAPPTNLTNPNDRREEDAKFSADGTRIVFKERRWDSSQEDFVFDIKTMALDGSDILPVTDDPEEDSMPSPTPDGQRVVYARGVGAGSDIYVVNTGGTDGRPVAHEPDLQEYYPIAWDNESFLYARWFSAANLSDQTYLGFLNGDPPVRLPFNEENANFSDHAVGEGPYLFVSSTRGGGDGGYDLYLADMLTGALWSLSEVSPEVNSPLHELGAAYAAGPSGPAPVVSQSGTADAGGVLGQRDGPEKPPGRFVLHPNVPNPFNSSTRIRFELPYPGRVYLAVFSVLGQEARRLVDAELPAGRHSAVWDGRNAGGEALGTGVYFLWLRVRSADGTLHDAQKRVVVLR